MLAVSERVGEFMATNTDISLILDLIPAGVKE
jgi:hypothetical protein